MNANSIPPQSPGLIETIYPGNLATIINPEAGCAINPAERMRYTGLPTPISLLLLALVFLPARAFSADDHFATRPMIAIWRDSGGMSRVQVAPSLRLAIWNDGRVLFAKDPKKWSNDLFEGRITQDRLAALKKALSESGILELKGTCYLVPDAPVHCLMIDLENKQQILYWDEVETPGYGINISPKPQHIAFKKCWKDVNQLALSVIPEQSKPFQGRFTRPPQSWRPKDPIASE